jgi:hypothetical protein
LTANFLEKSLITSLFKKLLERKLFRKKFDQKPEWRRGQAVQRKSFEKSFK